MIDPPALSHPISFRVLIDEAMKWTRRHFRSIFLPVAVPFAIAQLSVVIVQLVWMGEVFDFASLQDPDRLPTNFWAMGCVFFAFVVALGAFQWATVNVILASTTDAVEGRPISILRSWKWLAQGRVAMTLFLVYLAVVAGFLCCCVPGIAVSVIWAFVTPVMVEERLHLSAALGRSYDLARYSPDGKITSTGWFKVLMLGVIAYAVATIVGFLVQAPFLGLQQWLMYRDAFGATDPAQLFGATTQMMWLQAPMQVISALISITVQIYACFGVSLLYADLRGRREGGDLDAVLDALEVPGPPPAGAG